jgi:DedD protein
MGLFSNKNKRDRAAQDSGRFYSKDDDAAIGARARAKRASHGGGAAAGSNRRSANDPMLPEKKRARRRLVGAIALALAAAVGLPMLLDSTPKPLAGDIAIDIPAKDKAPALPVPAAPADAAASAAASAPATPPATAAAPAAPAPSASAAVAPASRARSVSAADSMDKGEEVIAAPPPVRKLELKPQAVAELPKPEHKDKPEHERKDVKADTRLADKAADKPVKAKPEAKPEDKPVKPRDDARALAILEGKPAEAKPEAAAAQKSVLQIAAVSSADKAAELEAKLRGAGINAYTEKAPGGLIRVKVAFDKDEGAKVRAQLSRLGL